MITLKVSYFITHKKAENLDSCQDAVKVNENIARYAIADGATRSFFPKQWAELLVNHFCGMTDLILSQENWKEWLVPIQEEWYKYVEERVKKRNQFYLTNSLNTREPAVSTFIGLEVDKTISEWQAVIIGDSCLFHISDSGLKSYLIEKLEDFTIRPEAFASFPERHQGAPQFIRGEIRSGDMFILATDALAKWILEHEEVANLDGVLNQFRQIVDGESFNQFVHKERDNEDIRLVNDDVTLMLIWVEECESFEIEDDEQKNFSEIQISENVET
ncbi:MAG: protein phosphatase 2C domain-containing protein [Candidatus Poribacteria bacterium]|nr:protein phosphatase 2C domain-containing protein [Candidatus Poribacteria bacterium]